MPNTGTCDRCKLEKEVIDISDNPVHTINDNGEHIDIHIICADYLEYFLDKLRDFYGG